MSRRTRPINWDDADWESPGYSSHSSHEAQTQTVRRRRRSRSLPVIDADTSPIREEYDTELNYRRKRIGSNISEDSDSVDSGGYRSWDFSSFWDRSTSAFDSAILRKLLTGVALVGLVLLMLALIPEKAEKPDVDVHVLEQGGTPQTIPRPAENRYFRSKLSGQAVDAYDVFLYCIEQHQSQSMDVFVSNLDQVSTIMDFLYWDYAEYFWFQNYGYHYTEVPDGYMVSIEPVYLCTKAERDQQQATVDAAVQPIIDQLRGKSDYEKVLGVYSYLIDRFRYDLGYQESSLYFAFRDNRAVCEEYAKATKYMLTKLGVETLYVVGHTTDGGTEGHAWNIVKVNGVYYQLDTTWGDPVMEDATQTLIYDYCMINDEVMRRDHIYDASMYPVCNAMDAHYFVKEGRYFYQYDKQRIAELLRVPLANQEEVSFRFANEQAYQEAKSRLFDQEEIWDIVETLGWRGERNHYVQRSDDQTYVISVTISIQ